MKVCAIGDPHGDIAKIRKIPLNDIDLILLTGDLGKANLARQRFFDNIARKKEGLKELKEDAKFARESHLEIHNSTIGLLRYLSRYAPVYSIMGNVGIPTLSEVKKDNKKYHIKNLCTRDIVDLMRDVYLVKNKTRIIDGLRIGFLEYFVDTSWVETFKPTDYRKKLAKARKETAKARRVLRRFGKDLDILICHQPPYGILDRVSGKYGAPKSWQGKHAGSKIILNYIRKNHPRYVFCGHIHEGEGMKRIGKTEVHNLGVASHKIINIYP